MKPKGISLIELHCEKLFLGLLALAALGVVAMQFTGEGNLVKVGSGGEYRLDQAYEQVASMAESKLGQLEETRPSPNAPQADETYADAFIAALDQRPSTASATPLTRPFARIGSDAIIDEHLVVAEVELYPPTAPITGVFLGSINPALGVLEDFAAIFGEGTWPRDVRAISIETSFDAKELRDLLTEDPDGSGPAQAAPVGFWRARHVIANVTFERQQRLDDGGWSDAEPVASPPGALDVDELITLAAEVQNVGDVMSLIKGDRGWEIVRPAFVYTVPANTWQPPSKPDNVMRLIHRGADLRGADTVPLWTHDYSVLAGETYRYRASVTIPNPYFGFAPALADESKALAAEPFLMSEPSPWGEPVTAPREAYWFAFSATDGMGGALAGTASCRLDVFGFVGGKWRHKQERFEPGQPIRVTVVDDAGVSRVIDTGARVLDVVAASLTEPGARGRQEPVQVVAASGDGLALREVWRDRASTRRRELLDAINRPNDAPGEAARGGNDDPDGQIAGGDRR